MKMYVIKYDMDIYAGTYNDMDGCYLYPSSYFNMHCTSSEEYIFQADIDKEKAVGGFCNTVEEKANKMIVMIRECSNIRNIFKKDRYDKLNMKKKCNICGHIVRSRK